MIPVEIGSERLQALLSARSDSRGLVIFAHGSGSGRLSPRNTYVAERLQHAGFATLLLDLLTPDEERDRRNVFDVSLLAQRLAIATNWSRTEPSTRALAIAYYGSSTGAAAALMAAALPEAADIAAIVSRGGRPDLAGATLAEVQAPTLLIVGGLDSGVIELNRGALMRLHVPKELVIIPGAGHLFEEPGALDQVVDHSVRWFRHYLPGEAAGAPGNDSG